MKKLSIITCTYNSEKFLQECIDSVKAQNLDKNCFEHIFIDANSTDKTKNIIEKYMKETSFHIYMYEQIPKGVYSAMNFGAKKSEGEYLMFVNSDDWLESNILNEYLDFIEKTGDKDLYYGILNTNKDLVIINNSVNPIMERLFKLTGFNGIIQHPTVIIRKDCFMNCGMFDESKKISSDNGMWLKLLKEGKEIKCFPKRVSNFRAHSGSLSTVNTKLGDDEIKYFRKKYLQKYKYYLCICVEKLIKSIGYVVNKTKISR